MFPSRPASRLLLFSSEKYQNHPLFDLTIFIYGNANKRDQKKQTVQRTNKLC